MNMTKAADPMVRLRQYEGTIEVVDKETGFLVNRAGVACGTLIAAPEELAFVKMALAEHDDLFNMLCDLTAALENCVAHHARNMAASDVKSRNRLIDDARALIARVPE